MCAQAKRKKYVLKYDIAVRIKYIYHGRTFRREYGIKFLVEKSIYQRAENVHLHIILHSHNALRISYV